MRALTILLVVALIAPGCVIRRIGIPKVYKLTIQQGNVITQEMVDKLKPGMTRRQVLFVMGEPVVQNPFQHDRWDYVYTIKRPDQRTMQTRMTVFFEEDSLVRFTGNYRPSTSAQPAETPPPEQSG